MVKPPGKERMEGRRKEKRKWEKGLREPGRGSWRHTATFWTASVLQDFKATNTKPTTYDELLPLVGVHPKDSESAHPKDLYTSVLAAAQCTMSERWNQPGSPALEEGRRKV